jgi:Fe-S oxidoreductase
VPLNAFFADLGVPAGSLPTRRLPALPQNKQGEPVYASSLNALSWKQLLDGDTCTECGRCQDACPTYNAGGEMSPKQMIIRMRDALRRDGPAIARGKAAPALAGDGISEGMLWSCTTCGACDEECPALIDHTGLVVDFRRWLISESRIETRLQDALAALSRYGNSFGQSERARAKWTQPMPVKVKDARKEAVEYLWFVGDTAAYNPQVSEVTRLTAELFQRAGLDFGILYEGERNAGNDVRRAGEEGLFEFLVEKNAAALGKCTFQKIVTCDPHSYNTLKNEYPAEATGGRSVLHSAELLEDLVAGHKLELTKRLGYRVTYHDPCYLGRFNGIYAAPRRLLGAAGCKLVEMPRHGPQALCCGAGGGRIWMDEGPMKERPSESRVREAAALEGVEVLVVACPKDLVMFRDAIKTTGLEGKLVVKEVAEIIKEAVG